MFDTISGLPVHALVVHAAVVLLPLMALVTIAFTVRPRWRPGLPWAILGNLVAMGTAYVAAESGGKLQTRLSVLAGEEVAAEHGDLGSVLPNFGIGLVVASVLAYLLVGRSARSGRSEHSAYDWDESGSSRARPSVVATGLAVLLVVGAGAATTYWTYRVGDSGAKAVWQDTIANTKTP
jgi:cytochrome c biogenesis protein CcdA